MNESPTTLLTHTDSPDSREVLTPPSHPAVHRSSCMCTQDDFRQHILRTRGIWTHRRGYSTRCGSTESPQRSESLESQRAEWRCGGCRCSSRARRPSSLCGPELRHGPQSRRLSSTRDLCPAAELRRITRAQAWSLRPPRRWPRPCPWRRRRPCARERRPTRRR